MNVTKGWGREGEKEREGRRGEREREGERECEVEREGECSVCDSNVCTYTLEHKA